MESDLDRAMREAEASLHGGLHDIPAMLADSVGSRAASTAVFGSAVEGDGVTVIPVAKVSWGFGGGGGKASDDDGEDEGEGSGGAAAQSLRPLATSKFRAVPPSTNASAPHFRRR